MSTMKSLQEAWQDWFSRAKGQRPEDPDLENGNFAVTSDPQRNKMGAGEAIEHFFPNAEQRKKDKFVELVRELDEIEDGMSERFYRRIGEDIKRLGIRWATIDYFIRRIEKVLRTQKPEGDPDDESARVTNLECPEQTNVIKPNDKSTWPKEQGMAVYTSAEQVISALKGKGWYNGKVWNKETGCWVSEDGGETPEPPDTPVDPEPGPNKGGPGAEFAVPVFKKFSGAEQEAGAHPRSLSSQLMKLFPDVDKSAITKILKSVADQLKASGVEIQENKETFVKNLITELLKEAPRDLNANLQKLDKAKEEGKQALVFGAPKKNAWTAQRTSGERKQFHVKDYSGNRKKAKVDAEEWLKGEKQAQDEPAAEQKPAEPAFRPGSTTGGKTYTLLYKKFTETIKILDIAEPAGLEGAMKVDQAFLGVFRLYKAMKYTLKFITDPKTANSLDNDQAGRIVKMLPILKKIRPLNEEIGGQDAGDGSMEEEKIKLIGLLETWIAIAERYKVNDRERAIKAMRAARGVKEPKEKGYSPADTEVTAGTVNTRQSVGPQLKAAGIDIKSPEGQKLQQKMLKVIRRFLGKNMKRMGKDISIISESQEVQARILVLLREKLIERGVLNA